MNRRTLALTAVALMCLVVPVTSVLAARTPDPAPDPAPAPWVREVEATLNVRLLRTERYADGSYIRTYCDRDSGRILTVAVGPTGTVLGSVRAGRCMA